MKAVSLLLIGAFALAACVAYVNRDDSRRTLLVDNQSLEVVRVYDPYALVGVAYPGTQECLTLSRTYSGSVNFYLSNKVQEVATPQIDPQTSQGWIVSISEMPLQFAAISLQPSEVCHARQRQKQAPP